MDDAPIGKLPVPLSPFVGREKEMSEALDLLQREDLRLLTLTGPGGAGKTRLALQIAHTMAAERQGEVRFVELASIQDADLVLPALALTYGLRETTGVSPEDLLKSYLRDRRELLVLDNFEQVVDAASGLADLLVACPHLKLMVTSRVALRIHGEQEFAVPPMGAPTRQSGPLWHSPPLNEAIQYDAVQLFLQRARSVQPGFALTDDNVLAVVEICQRLDGLPLAIELAAARLKLLPPSALLTRLATRLPFLTGGSRDLPARLQTMRAAIGWSYDLLDADEQALFRNLAVFSGGFTLEAAAAVAMSGDVGMEIFDGIASLVDKSLLISLQLSSEEPRFAMLETIREYGIEQLAGTGELGAARQRHLAWCAELFATASSELNGPEAVVWMDALEDEHDNWLSAIAWTLETRQSELAYMMLLNASLFWFQRSYYTEARFWLARALSDDSLEPSVPASRALTWNGIFEETSGNFERASELFDASLHMANGLGDPGAIAFATFGQADVAGILGHHAQAEALFKEAATIFRRIDEPTWLVVALVNLSLQAHRRGAEEEAVEFVNEALSTSRRMDFAWGIIRSLHRLARFASDVGDYERAYALVRESLVRSSEVRDRGLGIFALVQFADIDVATGKLERAARLLGAVEAASEAISLSFQFGDDSMWEHALARVQRQLDSDALAAALDAGRAMTFDEAVAEAARLESPADSARTSPQSPGAPARGLTGREMEVLQLLVAGRSDREIAGALFISPRTVQSHVASIFTKLGVNSRTAAATAAFRAGLVVDEPDTST